MVELFSFAIDCYSLFKQENPMLQRNTENILECDGTFQSYLPFSFIRFVDQ